MGTILYQCVKEILKSEHLLVEVITTEAFTQKNELSIDYKSYGRAY